MKYRGYQYDLAKQMLDASMLTLTQTDTRSVTIKVMKWPNMD